MRTKRHRPEPSPQRNLKSNLNILILGVMIIVLFGCFAVAGPLGLFTKLSDLIEELNPDPATASTSGTPILLGAYTSEALQVTSWELENFDEWMRENGLDKGLSIAGTYMDFEFHNPEFNVHKEMGAAWDAGYTPFVNLTAYQRTAEQVARDPEFERRVRAWAAAFAEWSNDGEKRAFIAPLQEMNGGWVRYGLDPENYKVAWHKIRAIFAEEGVAEDAVSWVFAPNAWSEEGHEFEVYYPGDAVVDVVRKTVRLFIVGIAFIYIGNNVLKWDITAVLASAGVLGLAIAFAAQDSIANIFGTLMILLDRPFKIGDRVILEGTEGPVEAVGFRSTQVRTLEGNQVSIPNKIVANAVVENVTRRPYIKRVTTIGVTYDTPLLKVRRAVEIIRGILKDHPGMDPEQPPRVYFHEFADCSLNILMIAWYHPGEYWDYLAWCEEVNFEIMRQFEQEDIEFAFPTTTTYLAQDNKRPLTVMTATADAERQ